MAVKTEIKGNTIRPLLATHKMLKQIAEFASADSIIYEDFGKGEQYILEKNGIVLTLTIGGNHYDGGYLNAKVRRRRINKARDTSA